VSVSISACSLNNLRRDFDDGEVDQGPVTGGRWSERGFLSESTPEAGNGSDRNPVVGHSERGPASDSKTARRESWVDGERGDSNARDAYRKSGDDTAESNDELGVSVANTPNLIPATKHLYKNGNRATRADFVDESPNEGSLWASDGQTNYYFTKNKIRGVGDILTINLEQDLVRDIALEVRRGLSPKEREMELELAQERIKGKFVAGAKDNKDSVTTSAAAPAATGAAPTTADDGSTKAAKTEDGDVPAATVADIDLSKALDVKAGDTMMAEILERFPNGNYKIRGTKRINYRNGAPRLLSVVGVVRGTDISEEDVVNSGKLYEYRLEAIR
jgi:flagellar basal body L-ring protein FlgH